MVPPSFHPSGEEVKWEAGDKPAEVEASDLAWLVKKSAAAAMLAECWSFGAPRHFKALALAGVLATGGTSEAEALDFVEAIAEAANDDELPDRLAAIATTYRRHRDGEAIVGAQSGGGGTCPGLVQCIPVAVAERVIQLLTSKRPSRDRHSSAPPSGSPVEATPDIGTNVEAARRFASEVSAEVSFVPGRGWLRFTGKRWEVDSEAQEINQLIANSGRRLLTRAAEEPNHERRKLLARAGIRQLQTRDIRATEQVARSEPLLLRRADEFDAEPLLLNLPNGTLNLATRCLEPHRAGDLQTKLAGAVHDPAAEAPRWRSFLDTTFGGDQETIRWLQKLCGYLLSGRTDEQVVTFFYGTGANGKSVLTSTLAFLLGDYACTAAFSTFLETKGNDPARARSDLARLRGARLVVAQESADGKRLSEGTIKALSGGDKVTARTLYRSEEEYTPEFKLILSSNYKPIIVGDDEGIWRRIRLLPFENTVPEEERDPALLHALRQEGSGILNWAIEGVCRWLQEGLGWCPAVKAASGAYRSEMDRLSDFLGECCEEGEELAVSMQDLYNAYRAWSREQGSWPVTLKMLSMHLDRRGVGKQEVKKVVHRLGLRLNPVWNAQEGRGNMEGPF